MTFRSGHLLALRRFPASSIRPAYPSVWHRDPHGRWTFFQNLDPEVACTRYFEAVDKVVDAGIDIDWTGRNEVAVNVVGDGRRLEWRMTLRSSQRD